jgi:anti-sigma factor RsiW
MSCSKLQSDLALYAGGDLTAGRVPRVESHLAACPECRALAEDLRAGRALLRELRDEPIADVTVTEVRRRVVARVGQEPRSAGRYWKLALAAALVLASVLVLPWRSRTPLPVARVQRPARVQPAPAPAAPPAIVPARHRIVRRRHRKMPLRKARAPQPGAPLLVQLVTSDPNIVIYWLVDRKPQGD